MPSPSKKDADALQKMVALDVGLARIGVATCDPLGLTVRPIGVIERTSRRRDFAQIAQWVQQEGATAILCGLPLNMDGTEGEQARTTRTWAKRLAHALRRLLETPLPILFWDERLTTYGAQQMPDYMRQNAGEDAVAAAIILRSYLDAQKRGDAPDYGRIELPPRTDPQAGDVSQVDQVPDCAEHGNT